MNSAQRKLLLCLILTFNFSFLILKLFYPSPAHAQTWQRTGTYPGGTPGFASGLTDGSLYSLNGQLYAIMDDHYTASMVFLYNGSAWSKIGTLDNSFSGAYSPGQVLTYSGGNLYAATRHINREYLRPEGDSGAQQWVAVPAGTHWRTVDETVLPPTAGGTADYIRGRQNQVDRFTFQNPSSGLNAHDLVVYIYGYECPDGECDLLDSSFTKVDLYWDGVLQKTNNSVKIKPQLWNWTIVRFSGINVTPSQLNTLEVALTPLSGSRTYWVSTVFVEAIYGSSLKAFRYQGGSNWTLLGDNSRACDTSGSSFFNCEGTPITGFTGFQNNLYVGTGNLLNQALVFGWNGSSWSRVASGGDPNPPGGIFYPAGGMAASGNVDLLVSNNQLIAASARDDGIDDHSAMYKYNGGTSWTLMAYEVSSHGGFGTNMRTLAELNSTLYGIDTLSVYKYNGSAFLQTVNGYTWPPTYKPSGPMIKGAKGMTACGDYLYAHSWYQVSPPFGEYHSEVWRINPTASSPYWESVGGSLNNRVQGAWHGVHSIAGLNNKVYVLTNFGVVNSWGEIDPWLGVYDYTGTEGTCSAPVSGSISGLVWEDADLDGVQDVGEAPVANAQIFLTGTSSASTVTGSTSPTNYSFNSLGAGTYNLSITPPSATWTTTTTNPVNNIVISTGTPNQTVNFGLVQTGTVQGYVWVDADGSCSKNGTPQEVNYTTPPLPSLQMVRTTAPVQNYTIPTTNNASGNNYSWSAIKPGTYNLSVTTLPWPPAGYTQTTNKTVQVTIPTTGGTVQVPVAACL